MANLVPRRVIAGQRPDGVSYLARIEEILPVHARPMSGDGYRVWGWDDLSACLPTDGLLPQIVSVPDPEQSGEALRSSTSLAGEGGARVTIVRCPPTAAKAPLHWHDTVDVFFVLSGQLVYETDDGSALTLRPGDCVVQHGANHRWHNPGTDDAWIGMVVIATCRDPAHPAPPTADQIGREVTTPRRPHGRS